MFASSRLLLDEWTLERAMLRPGATCHVAVEHEPPVEPGGSVVKVQLGKSVVNKSQATTAASSSYEARELVTAPGCTIRDLVALAVAALGVDPVVGNGNGGQLEWHLCTTNWNADRESAIDDLDATLEQVHVLHRYAPWHMSRAITTTLWIFLFVVVLDFALPATTKQEPSVDC